MDGYLSLRKHRTEPSFPEWLVAWRASSLERHDMAMNKRKCDACEEGDRKEEFHKACVQAVAFYSVTSKSFMGFLTV